MMSHGDLRKLFSDFWQERNHQLVPPAPLVLKEDPTTLFTSSGMQQLIPNLVGEPHPQGKRVFDIQPCIRTQDIDEVGDLSHDTFFEMMGNWSFGDYFKKEQLPWFFEFLTKSLKLPKSKLHVTVFEGVKGVEKDEESYRIWKNVIGVDESHIHFYGVEKNWWSRSGTPDKMPVGEIGGPDSEVFYDFGEEYKYHENSKYKDDPCHPNCSCGRYLEIGNSVFIQYRKQSDGSLSELPQKNVDFGGGLERILTALSGQPDMFQTDIFAQIIKKIEKITNQAYKDHEIPMRIIADHLKTATFMIKYGIYPSNKEHGYVLRRLLRRAAIKLKVLNENLAYNDISLITKSVLSTYNEEYFNLVEDEKIISNIINDEMNRFGKTLDKGLREVNKIKEISGKIAFDLYQSYGFPLELTEELLKEKGHTINRQEFYQEFDKHKQLSRSSSAGMFKGGLADHSEQVVRYHTATHLIHQALFDVIGDDIRQEGSNITGERLRFDYFTAKKPTPEEIQKVEEIVNTKIKEAIPVDFKILPKNEALKLGARSFFREKYPDTVKVYYIGVDINHAYSKEFCGGPHVKNTSEISNISIYKTEKIGSNLYRLYAK